MCIALLLSTQQTDAPLLPQAAIPWQAPEAPRRCLLHPCSAVPFLTHCLFLFGNTMMQQLAQRHSFVATPLPVRAAAVSRRAAGAHRVSALFGFGKGSSEKSEKELEKEEQFRKQQEVLARRRTNSWQAEVVDRRKEVSKYLQNPEYRKQVDAEKRARFKAKKEQEEKENPIPKFGIIVPLAPFGMPDYDETERFDLRLPFVDFGDPDPELENDPLGLKQLGKAFGFGKKKEGK